MILRLVERGFDSRHLHYAEHPCSANFVPKRKLFDLKRNLISYVAFIKPNNGWFTVTFPDVPSAITQGKTISEACVNAREALALALYDEKPLPTTDEINHLQDHDPDEIPTIITIDTLEEFAKIKNKKLKISVTVDAKLKYAAKDRGWNISRILQQAIEEKLAGEQHD